MARRAREADARVEYFDIGHVSELLRGDVFVARLRAQAKPRQRFGHAGEQQGGILLIDARHCRGIKTEKLFA
jgi:hypothetical protein